MAYDTLKKMVRAGKITPDEMLAGTPVDRLDDALTFVKRHAPSKNIRKALSDRITKASLNDFVRLKELYLKHCGA